MIILIYIAPIQLKKSSKRFTIEKNLINASDERGPPGPFETAL